MPMHINDMVQCIKEGIRAPALAQHGPCSCHLVWQDLLDACMETSQGKGSSRACKDITARALPIQEQP